MGDQEWRDSVIDTLAEMRTIMIALLGTANTIATNTTRPLPSGLQINFGDPQLPATKFSKSKLRGEPMASGTGVFSAPNIDMVPYDVEALDANGNVIPLTPTQLLVLTSNSPNAIVVPNSTDPTGATGNVVAAKGFSGAVGGSSTLTDSANPGFSLSGTWTGTFTPGVTEPISLSIQFAAPHV